YRAVHQLPGLELAFYKLTKVVPRIPRPFYKDEGFFYFHSSYNLNHCVRRVCFLQGIIERLELVRSRYVPGCRMDLQEFPWTSKKIIRGKRISKVIWIEYRNAFSGFEKRLSLNSI